MTFTEAAIEVLRREGKPLHFRKIAEIAARENLLDHVGKIPDETMADQLAAHCRLPHPDRRLWAVQQGTFALAEWELEEDPQGMENLIEAPPEGELPYRGRERHPIPARELVRATGRTEARGRRREEGEERRTKRFPPPAEVAYEILAGAGRALTLVDIAGQGAERLLMPDAFVRDQGALESALVEDNRRREAAGRRPLFQIDGETVTLIAQPEPGERVAPPVAAAVVAPIRAAAALVGPGDVRRTALAALRRRLRECDAPTVEHVAARLLEQLGYKELKVAKRGREHVVYTAKRKLGLAEVRHAVRILRTGADVARRDVTDLRRDLGHYGAQIGVVLTAGEAVRDARADAAAAGQLPVLLLAGEALAEAFADAGVGCVPVMVPEVDDAFFKTAAEAAEQEEAARRTRREERDERERRDGTGREEGRREEGRREEGRREEGRREEGRREEGRREEGRREEGRREEGRREEGRRDEGRRDEGRRDAPRRDEGRRDEPRREDRAAASQAIALDGSGDRAEDESDTGPSIVVVAGELPLDSHAAVSAEVAGTDEDANDEGPDGDEGDDEGDAAEGPRDAAVAGAEGAPGTEAGAAGERRRRRRRRRRRGGRGRGRENAAAAAGGAAPDASSTAAGGAPDAGTPDGGTGSSPDAVASTAPDAAASVSAPVATPATEPSASPQPPPLPPLPAGGDEGGGT
jgi:ribonuclease E